MPIDDQNFIDKKRVASDVCVYLSEGPGLLILRLLKDDGSVVDPATAGFKLKNLTWNQYNKAGGGGDDLYFGVLKTEHYSLELHGIEVWSFGEARTFGPASSAAAEAERERTFEDILRFMKNHTATYVSTVKPPATRRARETVTFLDHGDMGVPWDPKLFLRNNY